MNIRQIEAFHAVIETGSATRAAERLGITQPAISKLLKAFSEDCGFMLFQRKGGQLVPTREAQILAVEVAKMFSGAKRIREVARAVRDQEWGEISIAAPPAFSVRFLPWVISRNVRQMDLSVQILSRSSPSIIELIATQQVDLGLSTIPVDHPDVVSEHLITFPLICMLPVGHPLSEREELHLHDLRNETFIALPSSDCSFTRAERTFQVLSSPSKGRIEVPFSESAAMLVAQGAGVTIVPPFVGLDLDSRQVVRRALQPAEQIDLWLLKPKQHPSSLVVNLLVELFTEVFQRLGGAPLSAIGQDLADLGFSNRKRMTAD